MRSLKEDIYDLHVYISVQQPEFHKIACRYPTFPCADVINLQSREGKKPQDESDHVVMKATLASKAKRK